MVMVPRVVPGETVAVRLLQQKRGYAHAELVEVLQPGAMRVEPPCAYYDQCGGCDLQHISYSDQLLIKQQILIEQFDRGMVGDTSWRQKLSDIQPAQEPFNYRQRVRFQIAGRGEIGFFRRRSQEVIPVSKCLIAAPIINKVFAELLENKGACHIIEHSEAVELLHDQREDTVAALFHFTRKPRAMDSVQAAKCVEEITALNSLFIKTKFSGDFGPFQRETPEGGNRPSGVLHYAVHLADGKTVTMLFEVGGFCQVNAGQNEKLVQTLLDWGSPAGETTILDLYCGLGNFSIPAALYGKRVVGMDIQRSAIRSARKNAENNGLSNCLFEQKSALEAAHNLAESGASFDLVILDPPRQGCKEIIPYIEKIASSRVIYISCDPATLARDLALLSSSGFQVEKIQGLDMFPQTHHIETIVSLKKTAAI